MIACPTIRATNTVMKADMIITVANIVVDSLTYLVKIKLGMRE